MKKQALGLPSGTTSVALLVSDHRREETVSPDRLLQDDPTTASSKVAVFQYLTVAVFIFLVSGFWRLQVQNPDHYSEAAERNRIKSTPYLRRGAKFSTATAASSSTTKRLTRCC